ncbi:hypothetical protein SAMN04487895_10954 [Paenibacillus sophorae]|uniref:Uncharacterized protein n=1 Tax=Paenibacillus sophorae TaxID=1333845 RepID=A0A1H8QXQ2_9BACL|nr:hypothetical protein [Paenibacillus sophorae]QWU14880.1 hypothetical protein KP014_23645 [Paenibacillus sophorae]SEO59089.1 hypothetical protein SAMN04487895_10954 [Paenibacillus sophorae]
MKLEVKLAKSMMENKEGMNHLWIQIFRDEATASEKMEIHIQLPDGIYRSCNLNGYAENERKQIVLDSKDKDVLIEIFTQEAIACGEMTISVTLFSCENTITQEIPIQLVSEDEMDLVEIDEQVVERIKKLVNTPSTNEDADIVFIQSKILEARSNEFSYLEKKYRVDY